MRRINIMSHFLSIKQVLINLMSVEVRCPGGDTSIQSVILLGLLELTLIRGFGKCFLSLFLLYILKYFLYLQLKEPYSALRATHNDHKGKA